MTRLQDGFNSTTQTATVVALADGRKPFGKPNQFGNEIILTPFWENGMPSYFTRGNQLRSDYSKVIRSKRGVWYLKANEGENGWIDMSVRFYDTLRNDSEEFSYIEFDGIKFQNSKELVICIPKYENEDHDVMLEESLTNSSGILVPAFRALAKGMLAKVAGANYSISPLDIAKKATTNGEDL